jgi:hypothetical protein
MAGHIDEGKPEQICNLTRFEFLRGLDQPPHLCWNITLKVAKKWPERSSHYLLIMTSEISHWQMTV